MLIRLLRFLQGYLKIRITGYSPERFLNLCKNKKISVWGLESGYNYYDMYIKIRGFRKLKPILRKTQTKVTILERFGLPFFFYQYRKRNLFFAGIFLCMIIVYAMTFFIWNIELEGNQTITDHVLMEYLTEKKIYHGMPKRGLECEQIVKDIRKDFPEIIWVSVSQSGTILQIHVKEKEDTFMEDDEKDVPCDIIADKEGIITQIITRSGTPLVHIGDTVQIGDILVSGSVEVLNDAKEVESVTLVTADSDIIIQTVVEYEEVIPKKYVQKHYTGKKRKLKKFRFRNLDIEIGVEKNKFQYSEEKIWVEKFKVKENFYLPIYYGTKTILEYEPNILEYSKDELETLLTTHFVQYCKEMEEKKIVILDKNYEINHQDKKSKMKATLTVLESVGIRRKIVDF